MTEPQPNAAPGPNNAPAPAAPSPLETLQAEKAAWAAEREQLRGQMLRALADYDNAVKRSRQEADQARQRQLFESARELTPVLDHFESALAVDPAKADMASLLTGVKMVQGELMKVMETWGVRRIQAQPGAEFDPRFHEAMLRQKADNHPTGHVTMQFQPGYAMGDRVLRPAKVAIAE